MLIWAGVGVVLFGVLVACGPDLEKASFNAWFHAPNGDKTLLGLVEGISQCRALVNARAQYMNVENQKWDYVCCLRTGTSECEQSLK